LRRAVITGIGVIAPNGVRVEQFWDNVMAGSVLIEDEPLMAELGLRCHGVARCRDFRLTGWPEPAAAELAGLGRFVHLGAGAARAAMLDSGLSLVDRDRSAGGVVFASVMGGAPELQELYRGVTTNGARPIRPEPVPASAYDGICLDFLPGFLSRYYGLAGASAVLASGCTGGLDALGLAVELVRDGELSFALAGAAESPLNAVTYASLDVIGCLSRTSGPVSRASRPFDAGRAGFVISEGAAFVVVEAAEHARARGARVYAEVAGFASTANGYHMTDLRPDGDSMALTIERALADGGVGRDEVRYICAHGSSTPQNDVFETNAFKTVFGAGVRAIPISSLKSMIGHSLSSASLLALVATVGALRRGMVPPTANVDTPDPACDLDYVSAGARPADVATALVVASGFGGVHSAAVLRRPR